MSEIHVSVNDQLLKVTAAPTVASGGMNEVKVIFTFTEQWDGFIKTALFYRDSDEVYYAVLDENDTCILPWEVYAADGSFYFSVIGENGDKRRTTTIARYKVVKGVIVEDALPSEPTPDVYAQILAFMEENKAHTDAFIEDMEQKVADGYFNGEKGEKGEPGTALIDDTTVSDKAWSSKKTVDKLCPSFTVSGSVVVCEPLEGYPLTVISYIGQDGASKITLRQDNEDESIDYTVDLPYDISDARYNWTTGTLLTADDEEIQLAPQIITALHGENTFYSDCGNTTVIGKVDPNKYWAEKLAEQEAIIVEQEAELAKLNKQYELIEEVTLEEAVSSFSRNTDTNGVPYDFSAIRIRTLAPAAERTAQIIFSIYGKNSKSLIYHQQVDGLSTSVRAAHFVARNDQGFIDYYCVSSDKDSIENKKVRDGYITKPWKNVASFNLSTYPASVLIPAGTLVQIYAVRG